MTGADGLIISLLPVNKGSNQRRKTNKQGKQHMMLVNQDKQINK